MKIGVSDEKIGDSNENLGVFDETVMAHEGLQWKGVSDSTPMMMISS